VIGEAAASGFAPIVVAKEINVIQRKPLRAPKVRSFEDLLGGREDSQWIQLDAVVSAVSLSDAHLRLKFSISDRLLAFVPFAGKTMPVNLIDAKVRLRGVCATRFNSRGQLLGYRIFVQNLASVEVIEPAEDNPFSTPSQPLASSLGYWNTRRFGHQIKVEGVVTVRESPTSFFIQDRTGGARVESREPAELATGDRVEVVGFPVAAQSSPRLVEARSRKIGREARPAALRIYPTNELSDDWADLLVRVEGELVERIARGNTLDLVMRSGPAPGTNYFQARVFGIRPSATLSDLEPGCRLAITGVCNLDVDEDQYPTAMRLTIQSPDDVVLVQGATWFTPKHLLPLFGVAIAGLLAWRTHGLWREWKLKEQYQVIFDNASDLVFTQNLEGKFVSLNAAWEKLAGYSLKTLRGGSLASMISPEHAAVCREWWDKVCSGQATRPQEIEIVAASGDRVWLEVSSRLVRDRAKIPRVESIARDITLRRRAEGLQRGQKEILELLAKGAPLAEILDHLIRFIEAQSPGMICSVLLLDSDGVTLRHGAAPSLPDAYNRLIYGIKSGEGVGSCGTAVARKKPVIVTDIANDPLWANYRDMAERFGLRACWATPLLSNSEAVLGTFAVYYREPKAPAPRDLEVIQVASYLARIAIERKLADDALRKLSAYQKEILDAANFSIISTALDGAILSVNRAGEKMLGYGANELIGKSIVTLHDGLEIERRANTLSEELAAPVAPGFGVLSAKASVGQPDEREWTYQRKDGLRLPALVSITSLTDGAGKVTGFLFVGADLTARKKDEQLRAQLEVQLRQSQKMEAVGTLAGGIAHDFNNILVAIIGNAELLGMELAHNPVVQENVGSILKASERARDLVRQILSFSRREEPERIPVNLEPVILEALRLIRPTLPSTIEIRTEIQPSQCLVLANSTEVHQVLINLCSNAAHAMRGKPGRLEIGLRVVQVAAKSAESLPGLAPGRYARLSVGDTGHGMDEKTVERIFEPFFTTKLPGEGTGLGLAVVHGIIRSHNGLITVASAPGEGTRFTVYFPAVEPSVPTAPKIVETPPRGNRQRVLLVDDEPAITAVASKILARLGYQVSAFNNPVDALAAFDASPGSFELLLTDFTMPQMTGMDLASRIRGARASLPIIICTGHQGRIDEAEMKRLGGLVVVEKPFRAHALAGALRQALSVSDPISPQTPSS
jgi:PAS domain S-box-containing protein